MLSKIAVTFTISPKMYISAKNIETGLRKRQRWDKFTEFDQKAFLYATLRVNAEQTHWTIDDHTFELHEDGRVHLHALLSICNEVEALDELAHKIMIHKQDLFDSVCYDIKRNMTLDNKYETLLIKDIFDEDGWNRYIHKCCEGCGKLYCEFSNLKDPY